MTNGARTGQGARFGLTQPSRSAGSASGDLSPMSENPIKFDGHIDDDDDGGSVMVINDRKPRRSAKQAAQSLGSFSPFVEDDEYSSDEYEEMLAMY